MKKRNIIHLFLSGIISLLAVTSCDIDPTFYSQSVPETFYTSHYSEKQHINRPFTHFRMCIRSKNDR